MAEFSGLRSGSCATFAANGREASFRDAVAAQLTPRVRHLSTTRRMIDRGSSLTNRASVSLRQVAGGSPVKGETVAKLKVAINGFGRIGRNFLRCWHGRKDSPLEVIVVNDSGGVKNVRLTLSLIISLFVLRHCRAETTAAESRPIAGCPPPQVRLHARNLQGRCEDRRQHHPQRRREADQGRLQQRSSAASMGGTGHRHRHRGTVESTSLCFLSILRINSSSKEKRSTGVIRFDSRRSGDGSVRGRPRCRQAHPSRSQEGHHHGSCQGR